MRFLDIKYYSVTGKHCSTWE